MNRYSAYMRSGNTGRCRNGRARSALFEIRNILIKNMSFSASRRAGKINIFPRLQYFKSVFLLHKDNYNRETIKCLSSAKTGANHSYLSASMGLLDAALRAG